MAKKRPYPSHESPIARLRRERDEEQRRGRKAARAVSERREAERRELEQFTEQFGDDFEERAGALERLRQWRGLPDSGSDLLHALEVWARTERYARLRYEYESLPARLAERGAIRGPVPASPDPARASPYVDWPSGVTTREEELAWLDESNEAIAAELEGAAARLGAAGAIGPETGGLGWGYRSEPCEPDEPEADGSGLSDAPPPWTERGAPAHPGDRPDASDFDRFNVESERIDCQLREVGRRGLRGAERDLDRIFAQPGPSPSGERVESAEAAADSVLEDQRDDADTDGLGIEGESSAASREAGAAQDVKRGPGRPKGRLDCTPEEFRETVDEVNELLAAGLPWPQIGARYYHRRSVDTLKRWLELDRQGKGPDQTPARVHARKR